MDKRTADILLVIIDEYVNSADPVGSKSITDKYSLGISSATVRNEMHQLEKKDTLHLCILHQDVYQQIKDTDFM